MRKSPFRPGPLKSRQRLFAVIVVGMVASGFVGRTTAAGLESGVASRDITPPVGYRMSGYFHERLSTGTHDPLYARALALRQGEVEAIIVCCDVAGISLNVSDRARDAIQKATGVPREHIVVAATHSHTGPLYFGALRAHFRAKTIAEHGRDIRESVDYTTWMAGRIAEAAKEARDGLRAVELSAGVARQEGLSFNRRFHMQDGTVRCNPGKLNPRIVRVAGPIDPEVGLFALRAPDAAEPLSVFTVFALHLDTVGGTEYAADFPYYLGARLQKQQGAELMPFFAAGTCGDINHVDVSHRRPQKGHDEAERIGNALADTVLDALPQLAPIANPSLDAAQATVRLPLQTYDEQAISEARQAMELVDSRELTFDQRVTAYKIMALQLRGGDTIDAEVQAIRFSSDLALVALPGEVFVELGLEIKRRSPFATTMVMELTNDAPGYIPTKKAFAEGSYETINSRIAPGGGERLVDEAVKLLESLHE